VQKLETASHTAWALRYTLQDLIERSSIADSPWVAVVAVLEGLEDDLRGALDGLERVFEHHPDDPGPQEPGSNGFLYDL
jgi:hypothetical protein